MRLIIGIILTLLAACSDQPSELVAVESKQSQLEVKFKPWGVDLDARDESIKPGDDFYSYVNGTWLAENEIPPERSSWGVGLIVHERAEARVRAIIEELGASQSAKGTAEQKVGDYYASWMNTETLNSLGVVPIQADLMRISEIENVDGLAAEFGRQYYVFGISPFSAGLGFNPKNPDAYNINVGLSGLGLPDRDYYLEDNEKFINFRSEYVKHISLILEFAEFENSTQRAEAILALETKMARLQWIREDRRDRDKTHNRIQVADLKGRHSRFNWGAFLTSHRMNFLEEVNLNHPDTVEPLIDLMYNEPVEVWKDYLSYHMISNNGSVLSEQVDDENFRFWAGVLRGQEKQLERWKRGVSRVGAKTGLGEALGQIYVKRHFNESSKAQMVEMVENIRKAYAERIGANEWMSDETKEEAQAKLAAFRAKIGYPDSWLRLDGISIEQNDLFGNSRRVREFFEDRDVAKLGHPTDREEWFMMPQTVNAYYLSSFNEIVFPAAILEAPYFDPAADPAVNYAAIGSTIGHEMGHGFDDQGSKSDAKGVKRNWWTDEDRANFEARTKKLGEQYSSYEAVEGQFVDGNFTMGENIGDLGGLEVAFHAYRALLNGEEAPILDGLTGDQRFFLSYGQNWRKKRREDYTIRLLKSDPHSPAKFRVNGVVRNIDAWYEAFNVTEQDALYLPSEDRVRIW